MLSKKIRLFKRTIWLFFRSVFVKDSDEFSPHGVKVKLSKKVDLSIRYFLARGRPYEAEEAKMVRKYIPFGANVIELGGCYGVISALIRNQIGPDGNLIIVEANPSLAEICAGNADRGNAESKSEVVVGAIDYSGAKEVKFALGQNPHVGHVALQGEEGFTVQTTTLAEQVKKLPEGDYALVCDIEGGELDLFNNEKKSLSRVNFLILETHPDIYPKGMYDLEQLYKTIESIGFIEIEKSGSVFCFASKTAKGDAKLIKV